MPMPAVPIRIQNLHEELRGHFSHHQVGIPASQIISLDSPEAKRTPRGHRKTIQGPRQEGVGDPEHSGVQNTDNRR